MNSEVSNHLQTYITAELGNAALYRALAEQAPSEHDRQLLLELAKDTEGHAEDFQNAYSTITSRSYTPEVPAPDMSENYRDILKTCVSSASNDLRVYDEEYRQLDKNPALKNAFAQAKIDKGVHALHLLNLLSE